MSGQAIVLALALAAGVPLVGWALIRDCKRAERRAAARRAMRTSAFARMAADFERAMRQIREAMLPALTDAAAAFARAAEQLRPVAAWTAATDVPAWRRPVVRWWRRNGWRWVR